MYSTLIHLSILVHVMSLTKKKKKKNQIPYSVTGENIMEFLGKNAKVVPEDVGLSIHIIMDRASVSILKETPSLSYMRI